MYRAAYAGWQRVQYSEEDDMTKQFHLGDILSITTGRLVSPRHMRGVYDILGYMVGEILYTNQLPRVSEECKPYLLMEMPWLKEVDASAVSGENWKEWLNEQIAKYGEMHEVRPIHPEDHAVIDPVEELEQRLGKSRVAIVELTDETPNLN